MKIAINKCYGGFGLSVKAVLEIAKRKGETIYPIINDGEYRKRKYKVATVEEAEKAFLVHYATAPATTEEELNKNYYHHDYKRNDPILISVIEEMGEKANGQHSKIDIINIDTDIDYDHLEWDEYDGIETVHEPHKSW